MVPVRPGRLGEQPAPAKRQDDEGRLHRDAPAVGKEGAVLLPELPDDAEDVIPSAGVQPGHVVAQRGICYDNHDTAGTDSREFWCRRRKVQQVWIVERIK